MPSSQLSILGLPTKTALVVIGVPCIVVLLLLLWGLLYRGSGGGGK